MATSTILAFAAQMIATLIVLSVALLFIGVGILVLTHICVVTRVFRRRRYVNVTADRYGEREGGRHQGGLSPQDLSTLPCYELKSDEAVIDDCIVCLERFRVGDRCRLLPACGHTFHAHCVDSWLLAAPGCPICRTVATRDGGDGDRSGGSGSWSEDSEPGIPGLRPVMIRIHRAFMADSS